MRTLIPLALAISVTSPAIADTYWPNPTDIVTAHSTGLHVRSADGTTRDGLPFGAPFHSTMHTLVQILGYDVSIGFPQECGEGPLVSVGFPGQINLMFQDDRLAGWMLIDDSTLGTATGLNVGSPRAALAAEGPVSFFASGIGTEFEAGDIFGLMSENEGSVQGIWSGATCIFR